MSTKTNLFKNAALAGVACMALFAASESSAQTVREAFINEACGPQLTEPMPEMAVVRPNQLRRRRI